MGDTTISWTDKVWNPTRGCARVSPGCERCYAETFASRFSGPGQPYEGLVTLGKRWNRVGRFIADKLEEPLHWRKPARIFVNSMSDLFYEAFTDEEIAAVFGVMAVCPQHTFQVLTKRPERARKWFEWVSRQAETCNAGRGMNEAAFCLCHAQREAKQAPSLSRNAGETCRRAWPLPNVWIGASVEDQQRADERIPHLLRIPAAVRFVSHEPALGPVDFGGAIVRRSINWLIVGGESGPNARPFDVAWAHSAVEQCRAAGVPCFVKQIGAKPYQWVSEPRGMERLDLDLLDKKGGEMSEWVEELRVRQFPEVRP